MYAREIDGKEYTFGVSGKLIMNALVMYDRQTNSLWSQVLGASVHGPLEGTGLDLVSSQLVPWGAWKEEHPDTLVLDTKGRTYDSYLPYYFNGQAGVIGRANNDERLETKALIVGDSGQKAYSYRDLAATAVVNDTFEGAPLAVALNTETGGTSVFNRDVNNQELSFRASDDPSRIVDQQTGTIWNIGTGEAISGKLKGEVLDRALFVAAFWFSWADFYPDTQVYQP